MWTRRTGDDEGMLDADSPDVQHSSLIEVVACNGAVSHARWIVNICVSLTMPAVKHGQGPLQFLPIKSTSRDTIIWHSY